jgi:CheY-like chemotaxis protein
MALEEQILLSVEDSDSDFHLIKMAVRDLGPNLTVFRAYDGEQAIAFLNQSGDYKSVPRPHLVLLDAQLPRLSGLQVLEHIKSSEALRSIAVVMFTSFSDPQEVQQALKLGADTVLRKPVRFDEFREKLQIVYRQHLETFAAVA